MEEMIHKIELFLEKEKGIRNKVLLKNAIENLKEYSRANNKFNL